MSKKPRGTLVLFPLSDDDIQTFITVGDKVWEANNPGSGTRPFEDALCAIGMPITDKQFEIVGYADERDLPLTRPELSKVHYTSIACAPSAAHQSPLVKLSEAQAQNAVLAAEATRLRSLLQSILPKASTACVRSLNGRESRLLAGYCAAAREVLKGGAA